ncbi:hypothetical protein [Flavobacterium sp.]|uniref:hypothetical protein n=1 Tax=Flavobacterium sp. TaxID=239 RepID=UPI00261F9D7C|nr:hypothetical protein [Flavobacterium sp.]
MSHTLVLNHLQRVLNLCGDNVRLIPTGDVVNSEMPGHLSVEIRPVRIKKHNNNCSVPPPQPMCQDDKEDSYAINRVRISTSMIDDYSKKFPYTDEEIIGLISGKTYLFGCYRQ